MNATCRQSLHRASPRVMRVMGDWTVLTMLVLILEISRRLQEVVALDHRVILGEAIFAMSARMIALQRTRAMLAMMHLIRAEMVTLTISKRLIRATGWILVIEMRTVRRLQNASLAFLLLSYCPMHRLLRVQSPRLVGPGKGPSMCSITSIQHDLH
jgi:hypothetical protein